ncbi:MAG TPA: hypothetical protein VH988_30605 [Thermoanaerobaculia bacterium]|jgi:hypothetical protein|nr:hypothetical protein [Thermoanaerobaculia bacterium]
MAAPLRRAQAAAHRGEGPGAKLLSLLQEKPKETLGALVGLGGAVGSAVYGLGFVTLRAREALLRPSPRFTYPTQEWLFTGFDALGALFWRGLSVLAADHPVLQRSAWTLLAIILAAVLTARARRRPALLLGALTLSTLLLIAGGGLYRTALAASSSPDEGPSWGFHCGTRLSANLSDRVAFETCSWLVNDSSRNDARRSDLSGLLGWLLAASLATAVAGARAPVASRWLSRWRWALIGVNSLLGFLLLCDLPRAHAFGTWGLRYPQVRIQEKCDPSLARATVAGACRAFDVSADAQNKVVFLQGSGCPEGRESSFVPPEQR